MNVYVPSIYSTRLFHMTPESEWPFLCPVRVYRISQIMKDFFILKIFIYTVAFMIVYVQDAREKVRCVRHPLLNI